MLNLSQLHENDKLYLYVRHVAHKANKANPEALKAMEEKAATLKAELEAAGININDIRFFSSPQPRALETAFAIMDGLLGKRTGVISLPNLDAASASFPEEVAALVQKQKDTNDPRSVERMFCDELPHIAAEQGHSISIATDEINEEFEQTRVTVITSHGGAIEPFLQGVEKGEIDSTKIDYLLKTGEIVQVIEHEDMTCEVYYPEKPAV
ncbi:MAG: hypothetical protein JW816_00550 [Candidatus Buchananbacteria bacterium]|nr:hypothetical protein [Candidatus Buchananbacteria bacterium]